MRRAVVVMASAQHQPVGLIAKLMQVSDSYVRQVIHDFNGHGFEVLDPKWSGGRPAKTDQATREADLPDRPVLPRDLGWPFATWSLSKLADVLRINKITDISRETPRKILNVGGVSWQATKTWKAPADPAFQAKMARVSTSTTIRPSTAAWSAWTSSGH
ncbi:transposase [Nocardia sp. NPDC059691]|uniref:helix-turn-helix domain-containing protein n=1 Tax=Nocardia sp. NPDC059691 TaxID=3346908 RepID=UPI003685DB51